MTKQQAFDKVAGHLLAQKAKAKTNGLCKYRNTEGLKCAVGILIPDEMYDPTIEGYGINSTEVESAKMNKIMKFIDPNRSLLNLLLDLQCLHDNDFLEDWPKNLIAIANKYELNADIVAINKPE